MANRQTNQRTKLKTWLSRRMITRKQSADLGQDSEFPPHANASPKRASSVTIVCYFKSSNKPFDHCGSPDSRYYLTVAEKIILGSRLWSRSLKSNQFFNFWSFLTLSSKSVHNFYSYSLNKKLSNAGKNIISLAEVVMHLWFIRPSGEIKTGKSENSFTLCLMNKII